ncbi:MAG TPA: BatA and WFA domain-containing protein, partial [Steroidobacteraceae bacterium]
MMLLAPWFLAGLLAIGLPLWLHRFSKQTQERQPFASLMLIEPSNIQRSHKHTLKYLMLLALRIALIAAIAFSFAELVLPWRAPPLEASGRTLHVIVLDTSLSMQEGERWKRAVDRARELIDAMAPGDQGMLVAADSRIRVVGKPVEAGSRQSLIAALEAARPGFARLDYGMLMTSATSWIGTDRLATRLHLITDLQQSASPLRFADLEPPPGVQLNLVNVAEEPAANLFVKSVAPSPQDASVLEARIGGVMTPETRREVVLTVNGEQRARRPLGAVTNGEARVSFPDIDLKEGEHRVVVSLEPQDTLPHDDQFYAVLERNQSRALIVTANSKGNDASYLAAAVGSLTNPRFEVESVAADSIDQRKIADYSTVIVSDVGILSESAAR